MKTIKEPKFFIVFLLVASLIFQISCVNAKTTDSYTISEVNLPLINKFGYSVAVSFEQEIDSSLIQDDMFLYLFVVIDDISNNIVDDPLQFDSAMMFYSDAEIFSVYYKLGDPLLPAYWNEGFLDIHFSVYAADVQLSLPEFSALSTESPKMKVFAFISEAYSETILNDFSKILRDYLGDFKLPTTTDTTDTDTDTESSKDNDTDFEFTPGFELLHIILATSIVFYFKKKK